MKCIFCNNNKLYQLKTGQLKCSSCKKKFSQIKIDQNYEISNCFVKNLTANQASKYLSLGYQRVLNKYQHIRENIATFLEQEYLINQSTNYDEYLYLEKSKKSKQNIFQSKNFITFSYENKVYNLLMPDIDRYRDIDAKEFTRFISLNKISQRDNINNVIAEFWNFFESEILKYKGIKDENFFYYLKEVEFKFNFPENQRLAILKSMLSKAYII
jgi:transposase